MELVDLSYFQGVVDFQKLADAVQGVILRGGDGKFQDPNLEPYATQAKAAGIETIEAYHYLRTNLSPAAMAAECVRTCGRVRNAIGRYPDIFWFDMEDVDNDGMAVADRVQWLDATIRAFDPHGRPEGLYSGKWYWDSRMGGTTLFKLLPLWTAEYRPVDDAGPTLYGGWTTWHTWQYTSSGSRPGVSGNVDCDFREDTMSDAQIDARLTALAASAPVIPEGGFIRADGQDEVYCMLGGQRRWLTDGAIAVTWGWVPGKETVVNIVQLSCWSEGPRIDFPKP